MLSLRFVVLVSIIFGNVQIANAQELTLEEFVASVDRTPIKMSGHIYYSRSDDEFRFYDFDRQGYRAIVDAGRAAREQIEQLCAGNSFFVDVSDTCQIEASGSVEIRSSQVLLSIDAVASLTAPDPN